MFDSGLAHGLSQLAVHELEVWPGLSTKPPGAAKPAPEVCDFFGFQKSLRFSAALPVEVWRLQVVGNTLLANGDGEVGKLVDDLSAVYHRRVLEGEVNVVGQLLKRLLVNSAFACDK